MTALRSLGASLLGVVGLFAAACSASPDAVGESAGADSTEITEPTHFEFHGGAERIAQHRAAGSDILETQKKSLDLRNAYWLAKLSLIAYSPADQAAAELAKIGLPSDSHHFKFFENKCTDTQAFYVTTADLDTPPAAVDNPWNRASPEFAALVFRGTEPNWGDLKTDLALWSRPNASPFGSAHAGFATAIDSVWSEPDPKCGLDDAIAPFLALHHDFDGRGTKPIRLGAELYFTGHSLGAAVATLALAKTASDGCSASSTSNCEQLRYVPVSGLYTYGSPRPFNRTFANGFARMMQDRTPIMRFVHNSDVVPFVPGSPFSHPGFDGSEADFQILVAPGRTLVGEEVKRFNASTGGADHSILSYLPVLAERLNADSPSP